MDYGFALSLCLGGFAVGVYLHVVNNWNKYFHGSSEVPGPKWSSAYTTFQILTNQDVFYDKLQEYFDQFGHTFQISLIGKPRFVLTVSEANVRHMLKDNFTNYIKGEFFRLNFDEVLGIGIFNQDGEQWKVQRKLASHMFSLNNFKDGMLPVFEHHAHLCLDVIDKSIESNSNLDFQDLAARYTLDSIGEIAFGVEIGSILNGTHPFAVSFDASQEHVNMRFMNPVPLWLAKFILPSEYAFRQHIDVMNKFALGVVRNRRDEDFVNKQDILSRFMNIVNPNSPSGEKYTDKELRDIVMNFMIAGRDTTANSLSWAFYYLATNKDVFAKVLAEVDGMFAEGSKTLDYSAIQNLEYTNAFYSEVLRLHPSVPKDPKECIQDDVLPDGNLKVKAGELVLYCPYNMGRTEALWKNNRQFRPERFIEDKKPSPFKFTAFQAGPRTCLGQNMAYIESLTLIAHILHKYTFTFMDKKEPTYRFTVTLPMKNPLNLKFAKRK